MPNRRSIFLSYRRQETSHLAGRLADRLFSEFGEAHVFMDVDSIAPGRDFGEAIDRALNECAVLIALIGPAWTSAVDAHGRRRLDDPDDLVVLELRAALDWAIPVIPVLVDGATAPTRDDLPATLGALARRQALRIDHDTFRTDCAALLHHVTRIVAEAGEQKRPQIFARPSDHTGGIIAAKTGADSTLGEEDRETEQEQARREQQAQEQARREQQAQEQARREQQAQEAARQEQAWREQAWREHARREQARRELQAPTARTQPAFTVVADGGRGAVEAAGSFVQSAGDRRPVLRVVLTVLGALLVAVGCFRDWVVDDPDSLLPGLSTIAASIGRTAAGGAPGTAAEAAGLLRTLEPIERTLTLLLAGLMAVGLVGPTGRLTRMTGVVVALTMVVVALFWAAGPPSLADGTFLVAVGGLVAFVGGLCVRR